LVTRPPEKTLSPFVRIGQGLSLPGHAVIRDRDRNRHVYVLGKTGTGKSTLAELIAIQDIRHGHGVCFIDPKGAHAPHLLNYIPEQRVPETFYLEPFEYPLSISLIDTADNAEANYIAGDLNTIFRKVSEATTPGATWGVVMHTILQFALRALRQFGPDAFGGQPLNILHIEQLLTDDEWRENNLARFCDQDSRNYWKFQYKDDKRNASALLRRLTDFRTSDTLKALFTTPPNINIADLMAKGQILIVNLGKVTSQIDKQIIGTILITKFQQAAMRRVHVAESLWNLFLLFVDEFQDFTASPLGTILHQCRSFNLGLTLFHQSLGQEGIDGTTRRNILGIDTAIIFKPEDPDLPHLKQKLSPQYDVEALSSLITTEHKAFFRSSHTGTHLIGTFPLPPIQQSFRAAILDNMRNVRLVHTREASGVCSTKEDGNHTPPSGKNQEINASGPPRLSSHGGKKENP
jgi:hypothetical protein